MTDKAGGAQKPTTNLNPEPNKEADKAAAEAAALEEAKKNSIVMKEAKNYKTPIMGGMAKEFAQNAFTTKQGKELAIYP